MRHRTLSPSFMVYLHAPLPREINRGTSNARPTTNTNFSTNKYITIYAHSSEQQLDANRLYGCNSIQSENRDNGVLKPAPVFLLFGIELLVFITKVKGIHIIVGSLMLFAHYSRYPFDHVPIFIL